MPGIQRTPVSQPAANMNSLTMRVVRTLGASFCLFALTACPQDQTALQEEALQLKKQSAKLESVIQSLQEGNKVLQQQIDRLNEENRATEASYEAQLQEAKHQIAQLAKTPQKDLGKMQALEQTNKKLTGEATWLRSQRDHMRQSLVMQQIGGQAYELPFPYATVLTIIEDAITTNGYTVLATMQTDQKAIYITDRKTSLPPSLELSGFRNQYLVMIKKGPADHTTLWVRAEFEKLSRHGHIDPAPQAEIADIELRFIQEIHQILSRANAAQAKSF